MYSRVILFLALSFFLSRDMYGAYQNVQKQKVKKSDATITGKWNGEEKCSDVSAPVALLYITVGGKSEFNLSGIYSIRGNVKSTLKGDTIVIERQKVNDPNFMNLWIEGKLTFVNSRQLTGNITVVNNQVTDKCSVTYHR